MDQTASAAAKAATRTGWATFAGIMFLIAGTFHIIDGIAALSDNSKLAQGLFWSLDFWGVVLLILGGLGLYAGWAIMNRQEMGRLVGILVASVGIIVQLLVPGYGWSLVLIALFFMVLYALIVKGDEYTG